MSEIDYDRFIQPVVLARVNGQDSDDLIMRAASIAIHEDEKRATKVTVQFEMFDPAEDFAGSLMEDARCLPGAIWEMRWGYFSDMSDPLGLRVVNTEPDFSAKGTATLRLTLLDKSVQINRDTQSMNWGRIQTSDIAAQIAARYGLSLNSEDSNDARRRDRVQRGGVGDMRYLQQLARSIHFIAYVEGGTLHYHRPDLDSPPLLDLHWYGGSDQKAEILQSFQPKVKEARRHRTRAAPTDKSDREDSEDGGKENHQGSIVANTTPQGSLIVNANPRLATQSNTAAEPTTATPAAGQNNGRPIVNFAINEAANLIRSNSRVQTTLGYVADEIESNSVLGGFELAALFYDPEESQRLRRRHAEAVQRRFLEKVNEATINCLGTPKLRRNKNVRILGVGRGLSGTWHIVTSDHKFPASGSYTVTCGLKRGAYNAPNPNGTNTQVSAKAEQPSLAVMPGDSVTQPGEQGGPDTRLHINANPALATASNAGPVTSSASRGEPE